MNEKKKLDIKSLGNQASDLLQRMKRYSLVIFIVFVGLVYGFIFYQIDSLSNTEPTPEAVASHVRAAQTPRIDKDLVNQLEALQDNSVNVQTLFDKARSNPFQ